MFNWFSNIEGKNTPFTKVPNKDICRNGSLTSDEKNVLLAIGSYDPSYPSHDDIARDTGLSRGTVIKVLKQLKDQAVISWKPGNKRAGKNNEYSIHSSSQWTLHPIEVKNKRKGKQPTKKIQKSTVRDTSSSQCDTPIILIKNTNSVFNNTNKNRSTVRTNANSSGVSNEPSSFNHNGIDSNNINATKVHNMNFSDSATSINKIDQEISEVQRRIRLGDKSQQAKLKKLIDKKISMQSA